eukprot:1161494-Pelagomonas_calceolata.AAC.3
MDKRSRMKEHREAVNRWAWIFKSWEQQWIKGYLARKTESKQYRALGKRLEEVEVGVPVSDYLEILAKEKRKKGKTALLERQSGRGLSRPPPHKLKDGSLPFQTHDYIQA